MGAGRERITAQRVFTAALVLALHALLLHLLSTSLTPQPTRHPTLYSVQVTLYLPASAPSTQAYLHRRSERVTPFARAGAVAVARLRLLRLVPPGPKPRRRRVRSRIEWMSALQREAQALTARRTPASMRFGFPRSSAFTSAPPSPHWDGWDYAATHRIEMAPTGGTVIALNDRCSLLIAPIIIAGCWLGKIPVAGDLFKHMRVRPPGRLP